MVTMIIRRMEVTAKVKIITRNMAMIMVTIMIMRMVIIMATILIRMNEWCLTTHRNLTGSWRV